MNLSKYMTDYDRRGGTDSGIEKYHQLDPLLNDITVLELFRIIINQNDYVLYLSVATTNRNLCVLPEKIFFSSFVVKRIDGECRPNKQHILFIGCVKETG